MAVWLATFFRWIPRIGQLKNRTIFATAAHLPLLAIAKLFGWAMGDYHIYIDNFYIHSLGQNNLVRCLLAWLIANPRVTIFTYSEKEVEYFHNLSPRPGVEFIPFCSDFTPITNDLPAGVALPEKYIFTGGYSNRDYDLIFRLAERFPEQSFVVVASSLNKLIERPKIPSNILLLTDLPTSQFESLLAASSVVIIPLRQDVGASGQMLAISALRNAKPTIYTDLSVISYFFTADYRKHTSADGANNEDTSCGLPYRLGNLDSLSNQLAVLLKNPALLMRLTENTRFASAEFTKAHQLQLFRRHIR